MFSVVVMDLFTATGQADLQTVQELLRGGADVDQGDSWTGWSPLHAAAERGDPGLVEILVEHGARLDTLTDTGYTPLHLAASGGETETDLSLSHNY